MADMQRARGVGGDELDVHFPRLACGGPAVSRPFGEDAPVRRGELVFGQPEVDESGPGDLGPCDHVARETQLGHDPFRHWPGLAALLPCEDHGEVGRQVTVPRVAWTLEDEIDAVSAQRRGYSRELPAEQIAHSLAAFLEGLRSPSWPVSSRPCVSDLDSAGFSAFSGFSGLRGPFPSLP